MSLVLSVGETRDEYLRWCAPPVGGVLDGRVQRYGWAKARSLFQQNIVGILTISLVLYHPR